MEHLLEQTMTDYVIQVIDDGSPESVYDQCISQWGNRDNIRFHRAGGRGGSPAVARNVGLQHSNSHYIAFCDDDDYWIDQDHLAVARELLEAQRRPPLYITNQVLSRDNRVLREYWNIERLRQIGTPLEKDNPEFIRVDKSNLLRLFQGSCAHVNMTIVRADVLRSVGGFREELQYAEDLDLYLRLMDTVDSPIFIRLKPIAVQTIPPPGLSGNASRRHTEIEQETIAIGVMHHALAVTHEPELHRYARNYLGEACRRLCELYVKQGDMRQGREQARTALGYRYSSKWLLYTLYLHMRFW